MLGVDLNRFAFSAFATNFPHAARGGALEPLSLAEARRAVPCRATPAVHAVHAAHCSVSRPASRHAQPPLLLTFLPSVSEQSLERSKAGAPGFPKPGEVSHVHFSPPCQALSTVSGHRSVEKAVESVHGSIEEVGALPRRGMHPPTCLQPASAFRLLHAARLLARRRSLASPRLPCSLQMVAWTEHMIPPMLSAEEVSPVR